MVLVGVCLTVLRVIALLARVAVAKALLLLAAAATVVSLRRHGAFFGAQLSDEELSFGLGFVGCCRASWSCEREILGLGKLGAGSLFIDNPLQVFHRGSAGDVMSLAARTWAPSLFPVIAATGLPGNYESLAR